MTRFVIVVGFRKEAGRFLFYRHREPLDSI